MNNVLIVTESESFTDNILHNMNDSTDCKIVSVVNRHEEAVEILKFTQIDSIMIKAETLCCQAFDVVAMSKMMSNAPRIYMYIDRYKKKIIQKSKDFGIIDIYIGTKEMASMIEEIQKYDPQQKNAVSSYEKSDPSNSALIILTSRESNIYDNVLNEQISRLLLSSGFPTHTKGYKFLIAAINQVFHYPNFINNISKQLYPFLAEKFDTTPIKVDRAIRHAIITARSSGKIDNINSIFGIKVFTKEDKLTNGKIIALISDKLLIEHAV